MENKDENFVVVLKGNADGTDIITTASLGEQIDKKFQDSVERAIAEYDPSLKVYSAALNESGSASELTTKLISELGEGAQNNLNSITQINKIIRKYVNTNDLIGMVVQSISNNINTDYHLSYKNIGEQKRKVNTMKKAKIIIDDFNEAVNLKKFIRDSVVTTYLEGNNTSVLRNVGGGWRIDYYPLSIIENSGYEVNGNPVILVNIQELKSALSKTMLKSKNGKPLFFKDTVEEVQNNYPAEVYDAVKNNERYAVLDDTYTGMVRINNYNGKYGLSPIFRALGPTLVLDDYQKADETNAKAKAKKIIHQLMRKEVMGPEYKQDGYKQMAYAHTQLMRAWANKTVVVTTPPSVEKIVYVEPTVADTPVDNINIYRNKVLSSLGVAFLAADKSQTASTAKINLQQLMRCINSISEQVEAVIKHFYITVLAENGIEAEYCPNIKVIDSEMLEADVRMELSKLLYTTFNASRETSLGMLGIDIEDEKAKREIENEDDLDTIFSPRATSYTTSSDSVNQEKEAGRPTDTNSDNPEKQEYDKQNEEANK